MAKDSKVCMVQRRLGHKTSGVPESGSYNVCLSANQVKTLFGKKNIGGNAGCGTFACVWPRDDGKIVKITKDRDDIEGLMAAKGMGRVVAAHKLYELPGAGTDRKTGKTIDLYAAVVEKLEPLKRVQRKAMAKPLEEARLIMLKRAQAHQGSHKDFTTSSDVKDKIVAKACPRKGSQQKWCPGFIREFADLFTGLFQRGIAWQDAHTGNIGLDKNGKWKALDLGYSGTQRRTEIPALNGPKK